MPISLKDILSGNGGEKITTGISTEDNTTPVKKMKVSNKVLMGTGGICFNILGPLKNKEGFYKTYGGTLGPLGGNMDEDADHYGVAIVMAIDPKNKDKKDDWIPLTSSTLTKTYQDSIDEFNSQVDPTDRINRIEHIFVKVTDDRGPMATSIYNAREGFGTHMQVHAQVDIVSMWLEQYQSKEVSDVGNRETRVALYIQVIMHDAMMYRLNEPGAINPDKRYAEVFKDIAANYTPDEPVSTKNLLQEIRYKRHAAKVFNERKVGTSTEIGAKNAAQAAAATGDEIVDVKTTSTPAADMQKNKMNRIIGRDD
jgi:hypothetical protein